MSYEIYTNRNFTQYLILQGKVLFTSEELNGVPGDVVSGYPKTTVDGVTKYLVTHKTPDIFPIVRTRHSHVLSPTDLYIVLVQIRNEP